MKPVQGLTPPAPSPAAPVDTASAEAAMTAPDFANLADRMFDNRNERCRLDDALGDALEKAGVRLEYCDWRVDPYDSSLELDECAPNFRLFAEHQEALWGMGFARCWLNHTDGWETYYHETGDTAGYRKQKRAVMNERAEGNESGRLAGRAEAAEIVRARIQATMPDDRYGEGWNRACRHVADAILSASADPDEESDRG